MTHEEAADLMDTRLDGSHRDGHGSPQTLPRAASGTSLAPLKSLKDTECGRLAAMIEELELPTTRRRFVPGDVVYQGREPEDGLYILTEGILSVSDLLPGGKSFTTRMLTVSDTFGRLNPTDPEETLTVPSTDAAFYAGYVEASATALTDSEILKVPKALLRRALRLSPEAALSLATLTELRLAEQERLVRVLSSRRTESRLAGLLPLLAEKFSRGDGGDGGEGAVIMLRLTHQDLSDMISTTRESVTKAISDLQARQAIGYSRGLIVLLDPEKLRYAATG
ncbi:Crp/Fnr family transcriptional regulator [Rubrobacter aplysinae]|uniref:Crp/Fnr family transcriptional regulator n=1 Tax=Rubrobacter aplysinae TaxID=909625 RepID=UPI00064C4564|nr:Crp/Fnr family transcriptional regulator [Rubrobacter aplysinae]